MPLCHAGGGRQVAPHTKLKQHASLHSLDVASTSGGVCSSLLQLSRLPALKRRQYKHGGRHV